MNNKYIKLLVVIGALLVLSLVTSASYAFFSANVIGNNSANKNVITTGNMALEFEDDDRIVFESNVIPGEYIEKQFTVRNIGNVSTTYDVYFSEIINFFVDKNDLVYILSTDDGCSNDIETVVPSFAGENSKMVSSCSIGVGESHEYNLKIIFKEDGTNQDDNKRTGFAAKISVNGYVNNSVYAYIYDEMTPATLNTNVIISESPVSETISGTNHTLVLRNTLNGDETECSEQSIINYNCDNTTVKNGRKLVGFYDIGYLSMDDCNGDYRACNLHSLYGDLRMLITSVDIQERLTPTDTSYWFGDMINLKNLDLSNLDTSNVTNMNSMFKNMISLESIDLSNMNTSKVEYMTFMFSGLDSITNLDISNFDLGNTISMKGMFAGITSLDTLDLSNIDASNVSDMSKLFYYSNFTNINLSNFKTYNLRDAYGMFAEMVNIKSLDLSSFNTSNASPGRFRVESMFEGDENLEYLNLSSFDTGTVTSFTSMFKGLKKIETIDISSFSNSNAREYTKMFEDDENLKTVYVSNKWNYNYISSNISMFKNCYKLVGGAGTAYEDREYDADYAKVDNPNNDNPGYFTLKN